ncbi:ATP-dependent zinc protease [Candidatus Woesearchaeota archaeon]|nr:ATP-dependent zinc protease [Candidatus Woesearchaeota archaeon]
MADKYKSRIVIGLTEDIEIFSPEGSQRIRGRIDTGATKSSIDVKLASTLKLGPIISSKLVKTAHGNKLRPIVEAEIAIRDRRIKGQFTLADRDHMKYKILIGQNVLKDGFLIDPSIN